jgi:hypothetical protein
LSEGSRGNVEYKIPFTLSGYELKVLQSEGIRLGGFGVFWSGIFVLSLVAGLLVLFKQKRNSRIYLAALVLAVVGSVVINPVAWWARFVPQLWLFPVIIFIFLLITFKHTAVQSFAKATIILMLINSCIIGGVYMYSVYSNTKKAYEVFAKFKKANKPVYIYADIFTPNILKLKAQGIPFVQVTSFEALHCADPVTVLKMDMCIHEQELIQNTNLQ